MIQLPRKPVTAPARQKAGAAPSAPKKGSIRTAREFAAKGASLTEELPYLGLRRGLMFNRDGSVEFGLRLFPLSAGRVPHSSRAGFRSALHRAIIGTLPTGSRLRFYTFSNPAGDDAVQRFMSPGVEGNTLLREMVTQRDAKLHDLVRTGALSDVRTFMTVSIPGLPKVKNAPYMDSVLQDMIPDVLALREDLKQQIMSSGIYCVSLQTNGVFRECFGYLNPSLSAIGAPDYTSTLDARALDRIDDETLYRNTIREQLACTSLDHSNDGYLLMDNKFISTVSMRRAGEETEPGITERVLTRLAGRQYVLMSEFLIEDPADKRAEINEQLDTMQYEAQALGAGRETGQRIATGEQILNQLETGEVLGRWASTLILIADSLKDLDRMKLDAVGVYREMKGITPIVGDAQNLDLFLDCAPFNGGRHPYHNTAYGGNAIDFIPLVGSWSGARFPLLTLRNPYGGLTGVNPVENATNYGVIVTGSAGSGKTHLMQTILSSAAALLNARTITIDMKDGYIPLYELLAGDDGQGAAIYEFAPGATLPDGTPMCINMFDLPENHHAPRPDKINMIMQLLSRLGLLTNPTREVLARNAIEQFYMKFSDPLSIEEQEFFLEQYEHERRTLPELNLPPLQEAPRTRYTNTGTLSDFHRILRTMNQLRTEGIRENVDAERVQMAMELEPYLNTPGGMITDIGQFLDGQTNLPLNADHTYIRAGRMDEDPKILDIGLLLINDLIWARTRSVVDGRWTFINNEEVGKLAMMEGGADQLRRQYKLGREYGMVPFAVTQEGEDIGALSGLTNNASLLIFGKANPDEIPKMMETFGLSRGVGELLHGLGGRLGVFREYVVVKTSENGDVDATRGALYTTDLDMLLFSSHKDDKARREQLRQQLGTRSLLTASLALHQQGA